MTTPSDIPFVCDGGPLCCPLCHSDGEQARDPHCFVLPDGRRVKACCRAAMKLVKETPGIIFWELSESF